MQRSGEHNGQLATYPPSKWAACTACASNIFKLKISIAMSAFDILFYRLRRQLRHLPACCCGASSAISRFLFVGLEILVSSERPGLG